MPLQADLDADVRQDGVAFRLAVTNAGDEDVELTFPDAQLAEFTVNDGDDRVWRYGDGLMFAQMRRTETLGPGETTTFDGTWADPRPGEYEAVGRLEATDADAMASLTFTV